MPTDTDALFAFLVAGVLALLLVPLTKWLALRVGAIDYPNERSLHVVPTPKLGGLGILGGVARRRPALPPQRQRKPRDPDRRGGDRLRSASSTTSSTSRPRRSCSARSSPSSIPVSAGVTVDNFTFPFFGRLTPGTVDLLTLPGGGVVHLGDVAHRDRRSSP